MINRDEVEGNVKIAIFDGYFDAGSQNGFTKVLIKPGCQPVCERDLKYHESLDEIMPIVHKISEIVRKDGVAFLHLVMYSNCLFKLSLINCCRDYASKENIFKAVVTFIDWYNKQRK